MTALSRSSVSIKNCDDDGVCTTQSLNGLADGQSTVEWMITIKRTVEKNESSAVNRSVCWIVGLRPDRSWQPNWRPTCQYSGRIVVERRSQYSEFSKEVFADTPKEMTKVCIRVDLETAVIS